MSENSENLQLPFIIAAQAQKHVTHNEAIRALDAIVQLSVEDRDLTAPPSSPADGDRYIVAMSASGDWTGKDGQIAAWQDAAWMFYVPQEGWLAWIADEAMLLAFDGSVWNEVSGGAGSANPTSLVGINTTASDPNKLSVKSDAVLFSHDDVMPGSGDIRATLNKAAVGNNASFLFQDAFSGRAEVGLTGDDDFHFKVSSDGVSWKDAIQIDRQTGIVTMPFSSFGSGGGSGGGGTAPNLIINGDFQINQRGYVSGAVLGGGVYGRDRWKQALGSGRHFVSAYSVTITNSDAIQQIIEPVVFGYDSLANLQVTLSVGEVSGAGGLDYDIEGVSGNIGAAAGRSAATVTVPIASTANITVKLSAPSGSDVSFERVKLEVGASATDWQARTVADETALCQRYFTKSYEPDTAPGTATAAGSREGANSKANSKGKRELYEVLPNAMRAVPLVTWYSPVNGNANTIRVFPIDAYAVQQTNNTSKTTVGYPVVDPGSGALGVLLAAHFTADAEL